jgi:hypothetical protein
VKILRSHLFPIPVGLLMLCALSIIASGVGLASIGGTMASSPLAGIKAQTSTHKGWFRDGDPETWYARWVDAARKAGIAEPYTTRPDLLFCPQG